MLEFGVALHDQVLAAVLADRIAEPGPGGACNLRAIAEFLDQAAGEVFNRYAHEQLIYFVPELDFAENKRFRQGTQANAFIDYFAEHFVKDAPP